MSKIIIINPSDNVATAMADLRKGENLLFSLNKREERVCVKEDIPFGHKIALKSIKKGKAVIKYGETIGSATEAIDVGELVHTNNVKSIRGSVGK